MSSLSLHSVIDDEVMLEAFHDFVVRYHAEETLMFWLSVEVFKNRNWKAAKFFGMEEASVPGTNIAPITPKKKPLAATETLSQRRMSKKEKKIVTVQQQALNRQRQLDQSAANRIGVSLEQLYLVKEADFIFDTFIRRDGALWVCIDAKIMRTIEEKLSDPVSLRRDVFVEAQNQAFAGMNEDLMPRFLKELIVASQQKPIPSQMKLACERYTELRKEPPRRKTGVSTALAFSFRRRASEDKNKKLEVSKSSREKGELKASSYEPIKTTGLHSPGGAEKASTILRGKSALNVLGADGAGVGAMGISRSRLSSRQSNLAEAFGLLQKQNSLLNHHSSTADKRVSAPDQYRDSLNRQPIELGIQRSQSDDNLIMSGRTHREKEFGLDDEFARHSRSSTIRQRALSSRKNSV